MTDVLEKINYYRQQKGWSEYYLAERSSIPQSTINSWNKKNYIPSISSLEKICDAFGITLSQFFADNEPLTLTESQKKLIKAAEHLDAEQLRKLVEFMETL